MELETVSFISYKTVKDPIKSRGVDFIGSVSCFQA